VVRALSLEFFESLPGLIQGLSILLIEGGDVRPQLGSLARWEVFAEEGLGENLPGGERVGLLILQRITSSVPQ